MNRVFTNQSGRRLLEQGTGYPVDRHQNKWKEGQVTQPGISKLREESRGYCTGQCCSSRFTFPWRFRLDLFFISCRSRSLIFRLYVYPILACFSSISLAAFRRGRNKWIWHYTHQRPNKKFQHPFVRQWGNLSPYVVSRTCNPSNSTHTLFNHQSYENEIVVHPSTKVGHRKWKINLYRSVNVCPRVLLSSLKNTIFMHFIQYSDHSVSHHPWSTVLSLWHTIKSTPQILKFKMPKDSDCDCLHQTISIPSSIP